MEKEKFKKSWYKRWWAITLYVFFGFFIGLIILGGILSRNDTSSSSSNSNIQKPDYTLEMTTDQIFDEFSGLTDIQLNEKLKEFEGKRIKTSIYVSKINKATLSSQYVVMTMYEYPYSLLPYTKAFFPTEEKDNLLKANIGDTIVFSGEFVTYNKGSLTDGYIEFTKSKLIEIKKNE